MSASDAQQATDMDADTTQAHADVPATTREWTIADLVPDQGLPLEPSEGDDDEPLYCLAYMSTSAGAPRCTRFPSDNASYTTHTHTNTYTHTRARSVARPRERSDACAPAHGVPARQHFATHYWPAAVHIHRHVGPLYSGAPRAVSKLRTPLRRRLVRCEPQR